MNFVKSAPTAPLDIRRAAVKWLIDKGLEPSPENLLKEAKKKKFPLHDFFENKPDALWAAYGKYETARRVLQTTTVEFTHGGRSIETRAVEFVQGKWMTVEEIIGDEDLLQAYIGEIRGLLKQAQDKFDRIDVLLDERKQKAA